jgi:hypothetical protein
LKARQITSKQTSISLTALFGSSYPGTVTQRYIDPASDSLDGFSCYLPLAL